MPHLTCLARRKSRFQVFFCDETRPDSGLRNEIVSTRVTDVRQCIVLANDAHLRTPCKLFKRFLSS